MPQIDPDQLFSEALDDHMRGRIENAFSKYARILDVSPNHPDTLHHLGLIYLQIGDIKKAISKIKRSLEFDSKNSNALSNLGYCHNILEEFSEGVRCCEAAIQIDASNDSAWTNLGNAQRGLGLWSAAQRSFSQALNLQPNNPRYIYNLANTYFDKNEFCRAADLFRQCLAIENGLAEAHSNLSACLIKLKDPETALTHVNASIELKPTYADAWSNRGNALNDLKRHEEALFSHDRAIELKPDFAEAWSNRGNALSDLKRHKEALSSYEQSIKLKPDYAKAWTNRGNTLSDLNRHEEALASHKRAIELAPDYAEAWSNRGNALRDLKRYEEALASYRRAVELKPDGEFWLGNLVGMQLKLCDWGSLERRRRVLEEALFNGNRVSNPFTMLGLFDDPLLQKRCSEIFAKDKFGRPSQLGIIAGRPRQERIRIGYFSMDFRDHPVSNLVAELIEIHDRRDFEIYGFSFGPDTQDPVRRRLERAFDRFLDVKHLSDQEIASLSRQLEIDIAIDLGGYTQDSRPQIFAERVAPIQINYLGYPGTMGTEHMDYLIADPTLIPENSKQAYSEKVIYLPNSYQANDSTRKISNQLLKRTDVGLPESEFIFCCFNNNWKILPDTFDSWMQILRSVDGSVLWLLEDNGTAAKNLRKEAANRDVDPDRLVFAKRIPRVQHLARSKLADLFLDTFPYTAHTTGSDALWAGVPVLTLKGQSFAARVAASLLTNVGVPELITHNKEEYCSLAIELALNEEKLNTIRIKLDHNRTITPLFNTRCFAQHVESGLRMVYERYRSELLPDHAYVNP
jgi:predicted O-linked N-acetylglucosamine transferase (SPINDLY family)